MKVSADRLIPAARLAPLVAEYVDAMVDDVSGYTALAELVHRDYPAGVSTKTLKRIRNGKQAETDEALADAILTALDSGYLWHIPAEQGGLADLDQAIAPQLELELDLAGAAA